MITGGARKAKARVGRRPSKVMLTPKDAAGWPGDGGGQAGLRPHMVMFRGTSRQVCGLWPFSAGANAPLVGAPLGRHYHTGGSVCCDPIAWFEHGLISAPSMFVLGLPGLGKSSFIRHMVLGMAGRGIHPMVLGDLKPDYVDLIEAMGGQVIDVGRARINPLDAGNAREVAHQLPDEPKAQLLAAAHERTLTMVASLIHIIRGAVPSDREVTILDRALRALEERISGRQATLADLLQAVRSPSEQMRLAALDRGDWTRYQAITEDLEASLQALLGGAFGQVFAGETTVPMKMDRPVVFDVSALSNSEKDLQAAVLLACWSYGFASVEVAQTLADAGVQKRQRHFIIMDELWRILRASSGIVDRIDGLTRLNRTIGVGQAMITHTMQDLEALASPEDVAKAKGFVERSKIVAMGGLPHAEMDLVAEVVRMSEAEKRLVTSWQDPPAWDATTGVITAPPGRGMFLLKVGGRPGIPVRVELTEVERALNDTNKRWRRE